MIYEKTPGSLDPFPHLAVSEQLESAIDSCKNGCYGNDVNAAKKVLQPNECPSPENGGNGGADIQFLNQAGLPASVCRSIRSERSRTISSTAALYPGLSQE